MKLRIYKRQDKTLQLTLLLLGGFFAYLSIKEFLNEYLIMMNIILFISFSLVCFILFARNISLEKRGKLSKSIIKCEKYEVID